ncbi:MAG: hypothetical protein S0880_14840 [Actinomycetota bacterium]|nr:hypothetical protein [Actinomycetota bacterium]
MFDPFTTPIGRRTSPGDDGWLIAPGASELFRNGASPRRLCRWCGSQMIWTVRANSDSTGGMRCAGQPMDGIPSCDRPG